MGMSDPGSLRLAVDLPGLFGRFCANLIVGQRVKGFCPVGGRDQVKDRIVSIEGRLGA